MNETLVWMGIFCVFWGMSWWCLNTALHAVTRNALYRCRDRIYVLVLSGERTLEEKAIDDLIRFIHTLIRYSEEASLLDWVMAIAKREDAVRTAPPTPSFLEDERTRPIAIEALDTAMRGMIWSSMILMTLWVLVALFASIYSPIKKLLRRIREHAKLDLIAKGCTA